MYDKTFLTDDVKPEPKPGQDAFAQEPKEYPSILEDEQSLVAWQELFMSRRTWALSVVDMVKSGVNVVDAKVEQCEVLEKCIQVALENLQNHFASLQQSAKQTQKWAEDVLAEHSDILREWSDSARTLSELPVREEIAALLRVSSPNPSANANGTMLGMLDATSLERAAYSLEQATDEFKSKLQNSETSMTRLQAETDRVTELGNVDWPPLNLEGILQETETLATRVSRDYEEVLKVQDDTKSIPLVSRRAANHTQNLLPALQQIAQEVYQMQGDATQLRERLAENCGQVLKEISGVQSQFAGMQTQIASLKMSDDGRQSLAILDKIFNLPVAYGSTLIEAIRRSEWNEKMRTDLSTLRDDISRNREDEVRRRKKWAASLSGLLEDNIPGPEALVDLNFSTPSNKWPFVSREEIFAYIEDLRALEMNDAVEQVTQLLKDLESAVKSRRPKSKLSAFKNGSVYDLGQSVMRTGETDNKALQDDKARLEEKLRASESRIRKLEDLVHRQSQLTQPPSGTFTPQTEADRSNPSPGPANSRPTETYSRRSSVSLRRLSNQTLDEKAMVQRIVALEGQIAKLQQEAHAERRVSTESRDKMNEAESVKRDLMANFEAQRQEFDDERQLLDDENHKLKVRLEEVEDELDRVLGSRDHQRMTQEQLIASLRTDLEKLQRSSAEETEQLRMSRERLQEDLTNHRERINNLDRHVQVHKEEKSSLQTRNMTLASQLRTMEEERQDVVLALQAAHSYLSPAGSAPEDLKSLIRAIEVVSEGAAIHARGMDDAVQLATAEKRSQEEKLKSLEGQLAQTNDQLAIASKEATDKNEELLQERNKLVAVRSELTDEQTELRKLREKFAAGETGSGALRARLADEEKRVAALLESNGDKAAQVEGLRREVGVLSEKSKAADTIMQTLRSHLDSRSRKTKALSERLFQHNDRIIRMLESFGYSVARQEESLLIQRASKVNASTILGPEGSSPMKRTVSGSTPTQHYSDATDLETLYWASDDDASTEETKYQAFMKAMSRLDLDSTLETVTKRYKDVETLAKKYQKDSRAYRDRAHRLQSEAHDKIAYRSFKEGDLALFLPTRNQATRPWAAFNVGAPHYFLREQDGHKLQARDWLLARITKVEQRVVDLSRSLSSTKNNADESDGGSIRSLDENPFALSDGLLWHLIDAVEEKPGAPSTPHIGKSTTTASIVEVKGHMSRKSLTGREMTDGSAVNVAKTLSKSLDSRRSSEASRKSSSLAAIRNQGSGSSGVHAAAVAATTTTSTGHDGEAGGQMGSTATPSVRPSEGEVHGVGQGKAREDARVFDVVRQDLLQGP